MSMRAARPAGFTLVEIMIVLATIGVLSSVALPSFRTMQLRSKQSERVVMTESIRRAIDEYFVREGRYPEDWGGGMSFLNLLTNNPNSPLTTQKRPFRTAPLHATDQWARLSLVFEGNVYYSYWGYAIDQGAVRYHYVYARGDLDGDSVVNELRRLYYYQGGQLIRFAGAPTDGRASDELETPAAGVTF
jgi:prepilin-type N-terminal cleavage/methylation domain-containing protein